MRHATAEPTTDTVEQKSRPKNGVLSFTRLTGSSIAAPDAAAWVTDFVNAAYYRRPAGERVVDDLRLASCVLTTFWYHKTPGHRLRLTDLRAFHHAFGHDRFATEDSARGTLTRHELLDGAARLLGDWFPAAYADDERRGWGIAFETTQARADYDPACRMKLASLGALTPESAAADQQVWHTYPPVQMPSAGAVIAQLTAPETWPDFASEIGRFTPLRAGGLDGQTFEIEVAAGTDKGRPIFTRGYVTVTKLVTSADQAELGVWVGALEAGLARFGDNEPQALPDGAQPLVGFDLTTHAGHFMGAGHNRLLLFTHEGRVFVRAAGTWDPMRWHIQQAYRIAGRNAQHAFWGQGDEAAQSLLHQLALRTGAATPV
jgi:hypothetical protein